MIYGSNVYLPQVVKHYVSYFGGPWEVEPNNSYQQANGPLQSGGDYYGYPNDEADYFSIYLLTEGQISIDLTNHTGQGVQLQLFYQTIDNLIGFVFAPPYHVEYDGADGWYYIYIFTESGHNSTTPYTLQVTYPSLVSQLDSTPLALTKMMPSLSWVGYNSFTPTPAPPNPSTLTPTPTSLNPSTPTPAPPNPSTLTPTPTLLNPSTPTPAPPNPSTLTPTPTSLNLSTPTPAPPNLSTLTPTPTPAPPNP
jgi:hypothetical protein